MYDSEIQIKQYGNHFQMPPNCNFKKKRGIVQRALLSNFVLDSDTEREGVPSRPVQSHSSLAQPLLPSTICSGISKIFLDYLADFCMQKKLFVRVY